MCLIKLKIVFLFELEGFINVFILFCGILNDIFFKIFLMLYLKFMCLNINLLLMIVMFLDFDKVLVGLIGFCIILYIWLFVFIVFL